MEVVSKNLHKHALLIAAVMCVLGAIAILVLTDEFRASLTTRVIDVQPGKNGLAHIQSELPENTATLGDSAAQAGQSANKTILLHSASKN